MKPIGVFDSGIGGLTVVRALRELLPNENIFYLGDTARVPYGNKSAETVERYGLEQQAEIVSHAFLMRRGMGVPGVPARAQLETILPFRPG